MSERNLPRDPIRDLQAAVRAAADHVAPGHLPRRLIILGDAGARLLDVPVPACVCAPAPAAAVIEPPHGWAVTDRAATFDGARVPVPASRLPLLRALIGADGPLTAKELGERAFDRATSLDNVRYHIRKLRAELTAAFTFDGDVIQGDDDGYTLVLR